MLCVAPRALRWWLGVLERLLFLSACCPGAGEQLAALGKVFCVSGGENCSPSSTRQWELCPTEQGWLRAVFPLCDGQRCSAGYERYNAMRADPALCFLEKVGMPDEKLLSAEQGVSDGAQDAAERWAGDGARLWRLSGSLLGAVFAAGPCCGVSCAQQGGTKQTVSEHSRQWGGRLWS